MWVEFNTRVNYPVKRVLMDMVDSGDINMDDLMHKFCVSWFSICVVNVGVTHLIKAWNNHTIPGQPDHHNHTVTIKYLLQFGPYTGRRCGGMVSHVPNVVMTRDNRVQRLPGGVHLPTTIEAVAMYHQDGGRLSDGAPFGEDPLQGDADKCTIRQSAFTDTFPSFQPIFQHGTNFSFSFQFFTHHHSYYSNIHYVTNFT